MSKLRVLLVLSVVVIAPAISFAGPIAVQTFDAPHGWFTGGGPVGFPQVPIPTALGGPSGPTDPYLLITSNGGNNPGSRLSAINTTEFTGDFPAAGVTAIDMDLRNLGTSDVFLRLLLVDFDGGVPANLALTSAAVFLPAGSDWTTYTFDVTAGGLTVQLGTAAGVLANVDELRLFHNPLPQFNPGMNPPIAASVGVDNIRTGASPNAPEPATLTLLAGGIATLLARRRRSVWRS